MYGNEERPEQPPAIPLPELPGKLRLFLDGVLVLSVQLANQKWGALVPRWIVVLGFVLGCVPLGYDVIRLDRFIQAKGKISEAFRDHKFSSVFVALLVLLICLGGFGICSTGVQLTSVPIKPPLLGPSSAPNTPVLPPVSIAPTVIAKPVGPKVTVSPTVQPRQTTRPKEVEKTPRPPTPESTTRIPQPPPQM